MDRGGDWICIDARSSVVAFPACLAGNFKRATTASGADRLRCNDWSSSNLDGRVAVGCGGGNRGAFATAQNHSQTT